MTSASPDTRVYEDGFVTLDHANYCSIPGYLILRTKAEVESLAQLDDRSAAHVGMVLARAARAIEGAVGAERVYCLSFCEVDRRLHFHLFPRTRRLLEECASATGTAGEEVNGPLLFEWARTTFVGGRTLAAGSRSLSATCVSIRHTLNDPGATREGEDMP